MYNDITQDIKTNGRFCLWRYEEQNGRTTKVPYRVNGKRASSKNIRHFASFTEVLKVAAPYAVSYTHLDVYKRQPSSLSIITLHLL